MKTTIGGDRLGSGNKQNISLRSYERSSHDKSFLWRSSMSAGTLVPFLREIALPGDSWDIDLNTEVLTLPTIGPLFGSFKVQMDVFEAPIRLYNAALHMNKLGIGLDMASVYLPRVKVFAKNDPLDLEGASKILDDNRQINPSCILKYLGISGIGKINSVSTDVYREFNATYLLAYWDTYKNYYANKQEERGFYIHTGSESVLLNQAILGGKLYKTTVAGTTQLLGDIRNNSILVSLVTGESLALYVQFGDRALQPDLNGDFSLMIGGIITLMKDQFTSFTWDDKEKRYILGLTATAAATESYNIDTGTNDYPKPLEVPEDIQPSLREFPLENIDLMREAILQHSPTNTPFDINTDANLEPYNGINDAFVSGDITKYSIQQSQEGLGIKTYQSDLFNNWISTEWIDGANGVNEVTKVDTSTGDFTIDALNLAQKVYVMLNRIAISGGTYDDWLDAAYTHKRRRGIESPVYLGSLIKELGFQEVISNADTQVDANTQPLGTLAGRGVLMNKHKGGKIRYKCDEPSVLLGIVSITPRIDYSQGNDWSSNINTMDDLHKPALDAIGFQELITEQMAWQSTELGWVAGTPPTITTTKRSAGKQPAWINYMTNVNKTYGNFAIETKEMFMTLNRRYDINPVTGLIDDLTTYIDPTKFNQIFAETNLDAQNFWVQIGANITARRKMSAKVIPNL